MKTEWEDRDAVRVWEWGWGHSEVMKFPGCVVDRRGRVHDIVREIIASEFLHEVQDNVSALPALVRVGWGRDNDWVDRAALRGLLRKRRRIVFCVVCGRPFQRHESVEMWPACMVTIDGVGLSLPCHIQCLHRRRDEIERSRMELRKIRKVDQQAKALRKMSDYMDTLLDVEQAAALLPWRPHAAALLRMMDKGRLNSTTVDGERRLRGRDLLPLVKVWVETGRAPWRNSKRSRAKKQREQTV